MGKIVEIGHNWEEKNLYANKKKIKITEKPRTTVCKFVEQNFPSRQDFRPLIKEYINYALADPLHIKNNSVQHLFKMTLAIMAGSCKDATSGKSKSKCLLNALPEENILKKFTFYLKHQMNLNKLSVTIKNGMTDVWLLGRVKTSNTALQARKVIYIWDTFQDYI